MKFKWFISELVNDGIDDAISLERTVEVKEYGYEVVNCPVCGNETLNDYYICPHCGWEYDGHVEPNRKSSANNNATIKKYRKEYLRWKKKCQKKKNI